MSDLTLEVIAERIEGLTTLIKSQRADDQIALNKALASADKLAEKHNELIAAAERRDKEYATKAEMERIAADLAKLRDAVVPEAVYDQRHDQLEAQVNSIETWRSEVAGRTAGLAILGGMFIAVVTAVLVHLIA